MKNIYLDNAATTRVDRNVFQAMKPYFLDYYGNASEYHDPGNTAKRALEKSRITVAKYLGANSKEILFTGSATESINLAIKGLVEANRFVSKKIPEMIVSSIEHKAVLETCRHLENLGWAVVKYVPVDKYGLIDINVLKKAISKNTLLISIMYVNNEVGTIQPLEKIKNLLLKVNKNRKHKVYFHTDATQAILYQNCNVNDLGVDMLSFSGHKIYAPKGIGILYIRNGTTIERQVDGGYQESRLRSGTENIPYIIGLGEAINKINYKDKENKRLTKLRNLLIKGVMDIEGVLLTGHPQNRSSHIASFIVKRVEGESIVLRLSNKGVYISSGSACTSSDLTPSHVLSAMGYSPEDCHGSIRMSLGKETNVEDVKYLLSILPTIIKDLREMSPLS